MHPKENHGDGKQLRCSLHVVEDPLEARQVPESIQRLPAGVDEAQAAPLDVELSSRPGLSCINSTSCAVTSSCSHPERKRTHTQNTANTVERWVTDCGDGPLSVNIPTARLLMSWWAHVTKLPLCQR